MKNFNSIPRCETGLADLVGKINDRPLDASEDIGLIERVRDFTTHDGDVRTTLQCNIGSCTLTCAFAKQVDAETGKVMYSQVTALGKRLCDEPSISF